MVFIPNFLVYGTVNMRVKCRSFDIEVSESLEAPPGELEEGLRVELALRLYERIASLG